MRKRMTLPGPFVLPRLAAAGALALLLALPASAPAQDGVPDCFPPGAPEIPNGTSASGPDMVRVEQRMKLFRESATLYTSCMDDRLKRFGQRVPERRRMRWISERQKVVASIQTATQSYNESVKAYKARFPAEGKSSSAQPPAPPAPSGAPKTGS
jgi:hypothetical protein